MTKNIIILILSLFVIGLGYFNFKKETPPSNTTQSISFESEKMRQGALECKEAIKPELDSFFKTYQGGNSGTAYPTELFTECFGKKIVMFPEIQNYLRSHADELELPGVY